MKKINTRVEGSHINEKAIARSIMKVNNEIWLHHIFESLPSKSYSWILEAITIYRIQLNNLTLTNLPQGF